MSYIEKDKNYRKRGFAYNMSQIKKFCSKNGIRYSASADSYYFTLNGQKYRVSTHSVYESNYYAYDNDGEQIRPLFHPDGERDDTIYITAGKNKIIDIYKSLKQGKTPCYCF